VICPQSTSDPERLASDVRGYGSAVRAAKQACHMHRDSSTQFDRLRC